MENCQVYNQNQEAALFLEAYYSGRFCIHPTDTLLGLTCMSTVENAVHRLNLLKGRPADQSVLALVGSVEDALGLFTPLPGELVTFLNEVWPSPTSFIIQARDPSKLPAGFLSKSGKIGLRVPKLTGGNDWMKAVLSELAGMPFFSTSLNFTGQPDILSETQLLLWRDDPRLGGENIYTPALDYRALNKAPSTLVEIDLETKTYHVIRKGANFDWIESKMDSSKWFSTAKRNIE